MSGSRDVNTTKTKSDGDPSSTRAVGINTEAIEMRSNEEQNDSRQVDRDTESIERTSSLDTLDREIRHYINKRESTAYQYYPGTEKLEYDFMEERTDMNSTNLIESIAYLLKGSLGAGVLSMHQAYMFGGLWTSLAITIVIGFLVFYSSLMLVNSAQLMYSRLRTSKLTYPDLAEVAAATGPWCCFRKYSKIFRYTVDVCLFLEMCGTCCIYQIMIAHTLQQVLESMDASIPSWMSNARLYILLTIFCLFPLCLIRTLKFLAPFALLADIFVGMCVLTTLYYSLIAVDDIMQRPAWKSPHGLMRFCGICMYCTTGITVALPVENNMRRPRYFRNALTCSMVIVIILTGLTGFFGYWGWGEECRSPITVHMPFNIFTTILQFFLLMMLSVTFAVQFWVPFRIVWHYLAKKHKSYYHIWERFYRILMAAVITGVSIAFPNLTSVIIFLGEFFLGFIAIVFPALIEVFVTWPNERESKTRWRLLKNSSLIFLGLALSAISFYSILD